MDDVLESIFGYLDTDSLKQCRLVCSSWNPMATRFLMKRTFCELPCMQTDSEEDAQLVNLMTSVKINGALVSQLSQNTHLPFVATHWKSICVSFVPSASGMKKLIPFLNLIHSGHCPNLKHIKINFEEDPKQKQEIRSLYENSVFGFFQDVLHNEDEDVRLLAGQSNNLPLKCEKISSEFSIRSLHLSFDDCTNTHQASAFIRAFLKKEVVPNLKIIVAEFPESQWKATTPDEDPHFTRSYKTIMDTFQECGDVLRSLRVFKIQSNVPCGVSKCWSAVLDHFLYHTRMRDLPSPGISLEFTRELEELQLGSGLVAIKKEGELNHPQFFSNVLTPSVAAALQILDLSGFYISHGTRLTFPSVSFPEMPCLRKLTVEEVAFRWIGNFNTIFEKARAIQDLRVKNSWAHNKSRPFLEVRNIINFKEWEETWGPDGYPSLNRLELGDSIDVKDSATLQKINRMFPNIKVLQFICDDKSRRLPQEIQKICCDMDFLALKGIVEGLRGWKSLTHLNVTYWPLYTVTELLDHFKDCAAQLPSLRLYDFKRINDAHPTLSVAELRSAYYMMRMKEKMLRLKETPQVVFVLHNFHCKQEHKMDGNIKRLRKCSMMEKLFRFAESDGIHNFRHGTFEKTPMRF